MYRKFKEKMFSCIFVILLYVKDTCSFQAYRWEKYRMKTNAELVPGRLLELMRSYYEEANVKIAELNDMRFMYEESPHYEQGYIMGELIERFRKVVENLRRPTEFKSETVFACMKRVELTQKLYFEIYHLVRMMHESPQKYKYDKEFAIENGTMVSTAQYWATQKQIEAMKKRREKDKKRRLKFNEKLRQAYLKGLSSSVYGNNKKPYNKFWPLDYGWEIDYYWL